MRPPAGFIYLLGLAATPGAAETRQFLSRNGVGFRWVDVDGGAVAAIPVGEQQAYREAKLFKHELATRTRLPTRLQDEPTILGHF